MKEIADLLNISEKTAEFHKHHIMKAFNLESNAALILFALKQGLISLPKGSMKRAGSQRYWSRSRMLSGTWPKSHDLQPDPICTE